MPKPPGRFCRHRLLLLLTPSPGTPGEGAGEGLVFSFLLLLTILLPAVTCFAAPPIASAPPRQRDLLAAASADRFWVAHITHDPLDNSIYTTITYRPGLGDWSQPAVIPDRVVAIATSNDEILVVLSDGLWEIADGDDIRTGPPGPMWDDMFSIAAVDDAVWAVARSSGAATQPIDSTNPTTAPASQPASAAIEAGRLIVCQIADGQWTHPVPLPAGVTDDPAQMSLTVVNGLPVLAWRSADQILHTSALSADDEWSRPTNISRPGAQSDFKLLTISSRAVLWLASTPPTTRPATQPAGVSSAPVAGDLFIGPDFSRRFTLALPSTTSTTGPQTLVSAFGNLRWISYVGDRQIEQDYSLDKFPKSFPPAPKMIIVPASQPPIIPLIPWIVGNIGLIALASLAAVRQRSAPPLTPTDSRQRLAPMSIRFVAGLVDLAPVLAVLAILHPSGSASPFANIDEKSFTQLVWLSIATYILHTLVAELLCAQSLGKMVFGLRVMSASGKPARPWQILARNLLRIFDVTLALPLLVLFITPLRQRVGDLIATTVVATEGDEDEEDDNT